MPGDLLCNLSGDLVSYNLTASSLLPLKEQDTCSNAAIQLGGEGLRTKRYLVDGTGERNLDMLLLQRATAEGMHSETPSQLAKSHVALNVLMKKDMSSAQSDLREFKMSTEIEFATHELKSYGSWAWLIVITAVVIVIVVAVYCRCLVLRKLRATSAIV